MTTIIKLSKVSYRYPDETSNALSDFNLEVAEGEFILIRGPSGSGKSTLLKCISGLVPNYTGGLYFGSTQVYGMDTLKKSVEEISFNIGTIFQDPENQIVSTMVENEIAFGLENKRLSRKEIKSRMIKTAKELGIEHLLERKTSQLSSGEKQKVILASILAMEPRILLLDEPSSQLDPENTKKLNDLLFYLNRKNKTTVILVEHDLSENKKFDRIIDLKEAQAKKFYKNSKPRVKPGKKILKAENLCYDYGAGPVLHSINLEVREGEFISITGNNGSGKTTLLKHFNGLFKPKKGKVYVDGIDTESKSVEELSRKVGFLSQNPNDYLFSDTVADELKFTLRNLGIKGDVDQTLKQFNLYEHRNHYPRDLSGGERQRVALASILAASPKIVVLDEPTRGIDLNSRIELTNILYALQSKGTAILVATHDLKLAASSQRVIKLEGGRITKDTRNLK